MGERNSTTKTIFEEDSPPPMKAQKILDRFLEVEIAKASIIKLYVCNVDDQSSARIFLVHLAYHHQIIPKYVLSAGAMAEKTFRYGRHCCFVGAVDEDLIKCRVSIMLYWTEMPLLISSYVLTTTSNAVRN